MGCCQSTPKQDGFTDLQVKGEGDTQEKKAPSRYEPDPTVNRQASAEEPPATPGT